MFTRFIAISLKLLTEPNCNHSDSTTKFIFEFLTIETFQNISFQYRKSKANSMRLEIAKMIQRLLRQALPHVDFVGNLISGVLLMTPFLPFENSSSSSSSSSLVKSYVLSITNLGVSINGSFTNFSGFLFLVISGGVILTRLILKIWHKTPN